MKLGIKLTIWIVYVMAILNYFIPPYDFEVSTVMFIFGEFAGYLILGILTGAVIEECCDVRFISKGGTVILLAALGIISLVKPLYFLLKLGNLGWTWGKEIYFILLFGILLELMVSQKIKNKRTTK